jgi:hypothetical protein
MVGKRLRFKVVLSFGNKKKSAEVKSGEYGGWGSYWLISTRFSFLSSVNKSGTNFAFTDAPEDFQFQFDRRTHC